ncbi:YjfB family protein [Ammoniphilus sp. CFH 90114]|uniref:YjfB family protein n=1 Tax=Ammoniphilus sp. CFH 90114 TaxID=2493665 RepID=UPI00100E6DF3|nr:YjfB family protein [Ammoniphilus sp. CFH 90114]RXT06512.1 putative motility protein [Ammoniphilus sp. CFH 90114]
MDIPGLSMAMNQSQLKQNVSLALMKQAIGTQNENTAQIIDMLKDSQVPAATHPHLGSKLDISI